MNYKELWKKILLRLADDISRPNILTWFKGSCILNIENSRLTIGLSREMFVSWHEKNSRKKIEKIAQGYDPSIRKVDFLVDGSLEDEADTRTLDIIKLFPKTKKIRKMPKIAEVKIRGGILSRMLNSKFKLSNFIVGSDNKLAHAVSEAVSKSPGTRYNPLFIYGGVGLGKTHLLHAIGNEILKNHHNKIVAFVSAENFFAEFIEMVRGQNGDKFREKWRKADVFIIDDIQFLAGKERTEEMFFHLFNDLYDSSKQIVISSDKPPSELKNMSSRLVSRFSMGMIADLHFPDLETRIAILQQKSQEQGVVLDMEVMTLISENVHHSIREIEGILTQIVARIDLNGDYPNTGVVRNIISKVNKNLRFNTNKHEEMTTYARNMNEIIDQVAEFFAVGKLDIIGSSRARENLVPRQVAMWFSKKYLKLPLKTIGNFFGGRDHSSVIHAIKRVDAMKKTDKAFWRNMNAMRKDMGF